MVRSLTPLALALLLAGCAVDPIPPPASPLVIEAIPAGDPFALERAVADEAATPSGAMQIYRAATLGQTELLERHAAGEGGLDLREEEGGMAALHMAVLNGDLEGARRLLELGADPNNQIAGHGPTALHDAVNLDQVEMVELLLAHGAQAELRDGSSGLGLLHAVMIEGSPAIARRLIEAGANVNARDANGVTPLHLAVSYGRLEMIELLAGAGADLESRSRNGVTPLDVALRRGEANNPTADLLRRLGSRR